MPSRTATARLAWCAAFAAGAIALALTKFHSQDPDSSSYAHIGEQMSARPVSTWIAPEWWGLGGREGYFREHPVGAFLLPALVGKLGIAPAQAGHIVGLGMSIAALLLMQRLAAFIVGPRASLIVPWVALILPVAFINRIRATQEYPVFVCLLLAVYATQKSRTSPRWIPVLLLAACGMVLVKGIFVVFLPIVCGLWLVCVRDGESGDGWAWLGIVLSAPAVVLCTLGYDYLHQMATGESFLNYYLPYRLGQVNDEQRASSLIANKLDNAGFYLARLLWFGFPGTLALLIAAARWKNPGPRPASRREVQGLLFALAAGAAYVGVMSLGNMRAERFILPAYFAVGIAGVFVAIHRWGGPSRLADRLTALPPYAPALAWLFWVLAALPFELYVPYVKFR